MATKEKLKTKGGPCPEEARRLAALRALFALRVAAECHPLPVGGHARGEIGGYAPSRLGVVAASARADGFFGNRWGLLLYLFSFRFAYGLPSPGLCLLS